MISGSADGERPHLTIDNRGVIKTFVMISAPKWYPDVAVFHVTFQVFQRNGALGAREVSIRRVRTTP